MAKKKVREKNKKSQLAEIEIREGWVKQGISNGSFWF